MSPTYDDELINNPEIRRAVEARRAAMSQPVHTQARRWRMRWLFIGITIGVMLTVCISLIRVAG